MSNRLLAYADRLFTDEELFAAAGGVLVFDVESYPNYFIVSFMDFFTGKICYFERHENTVLQIDWIKWILQNFCVVGFNSRAYDIQVLSYAIADESISPAQIKALTNELIVENARPIDCQRARMYSVFECNHIDLIEVAPLSASLKTYAARLHCDFMQDLPYHPDSTLSREEKNNVRTYNFNDLENTRLLLKELSADLDLRYQLSLEFNQDFRSLSDSQIGEAIINNELQRITGKYPKPARLQKACRYYVYIHRT